MHPATTVYTRPNCVQCRSTFRALDERGVTYTKVNVAEDETAAEYVRGLGHKQAPVIVIDTPTQPVHWSGFNPILIETHFGPKAA